MNKIAIESAISELSTLRDMVRWGVSQFHAANIYFGHGIESAWDEAVFLTLHALHLPPNTDKKVLDAKLTLQERRDIAELMARRVKERKPAAYLTQTAWFAGLSFYVDERVIIPRSPMAELIERGFDPWLERSDVHRILDLCTGCGCIAVACAFAFPESKIDAVDVSKEALEVAQINVDRHDVKDQIKLIQADLFSGLDFNSYDLIISNPPYVSSFEMNQLPEEYRHEPELALSGGEEGLDIIEKILGEAANYLTSHGILIAEVGNSAATLEQRFPELPLMWLEFERGGHGVFLITAEQLREYF